MKKTQVRNSLLLFLTALIWGTAFVAQSVATDYLGSFTFIFARNVLGSLVLIPVILIFCKRENPEYPDRKPYVYVKRIEWIGGACCGVVLCAASNFQQMGVKYTTVGKAGFITALYVILVPILGLFFKKKVSPIIWFCVVLSVIGLYMLCMTNDSFTLAKGDTLVLICALLFSGHILVIDYFSPMCNGVIISCIQFFVCSLVSGFFMLLFERAYISAIPQAWFPIVYAGVFSSGIAYTLQIIGQKDMNPTIASLILCLESVVSALAGWAILHQVLSTRELIGCVLMFIAIVIAQIKG